MAITNGSFKKGHKKVGGKKKGYVAQYTLQELKNALSKTYPEGENGFFKMLTEKAADEPTIAIALSRKLVADRHELSGVVKIENIAQTVKEMIAVIKKHVKDGKILARIASDLEGVMPKEC